MQEINFHSPPENESHECESYRDGEWIIFYCSKCPGYERRLNWKTGEMKTRNVKENINHTGNHEPQFYKELLDTLN